MEPGGPSVRVAELRGAVAGAEVEDGDFVGVFGDVGRSIDERSRWIVGGNFGMGKDGSEGKTEGRDAVMVDEMAGEGELVEDVVLRFLNNKYDAKGKCGIRLGKAVGVVCGCETLGKGCGAGVGR